MWVSTQSTNGNIGGVNGATTICEMDAPGIGGLAPGLTHRAVIATSTNDPRNYFSNNPPIQRPDGALITDSYVDYFDSAVRLTNRTSTTYDYYWTGLTRAGTSSTDNCTNWSTTIGQGGTGSPDEQDQSRLIDLQQACTATYHILCISY